MFRALATARPAVFNADLGGSLHIPTIVKLWLAGGGSRAREGGDGSIPRSCSGAPRVVQGQAVIMFTMFFCFTVGEWAEAVGRAHSNRARTKGSELIFNKTFEAFRREYIEVALLSRGRPFAIHC